jgi:hypothetical protein
MANIQINQLPAAATLDGTEIIPADQGLLTVQTTLADVAILANANTVANGLASPSITADILANRPVSAAVGALFVSTLENVIYRYNGAAWNAIGRGEEFVRSIVAGTNISVDNTDPLNPIVSASGGGGVNTVKVSLTSADILSLDGTNALTLIPAQGVNTLINVLKVWFQYNYVTNPYSGSGIYVQLGTAISIVSPTSGILSSGSSAIVRAVMNASAYNLSPNAVVNQSVSLSTVTAPTGGDSTLDVYLTYDVITL